jgi:hypothetical protein
VVGYSATALEWPLHYRSAFEDNLSVTHVFIKGIVPRDFRPSVFLLNNTPCSPDSRAKAFLNSALNSPRYDRFSDASCNI